MPPFSLLRRILSAALLRRSRSCWSISRSDAAWTTLIRFEETLQDQETWISRRRRAVAPSIWIESASERVLNLMDKHAKKSVIQRNLHLAAKAGIWNHVMAFYGFPGETLDGSAGTTASSSSRTSR